MAAILTATPNPVLISAGQTTGKTTLTWAGNEEGQCQVREVVGAAEIAVAPPALTGSVTVDIGVGTHVYVLRPTAGGNTPVASVTVIAKLASSKPASDFLTGVQEGILNTTAIPIQAIIRLTVTPQADIALFVFRTVVPTIPLLEIRFGNPDTGELLTTRFPVFAGAQTEHAIEADRLPQGRDLFFKITAGNPLLRSSPSAVMRGSFRTGRVDAEIVFDRIVVVSDSDDLSDGDLTFSFFAGDTETMSVFPGPQPVHHEDGLSDGETAFIGQSIEVQFVPQRIWVEVQGEDDDLFPIPHPLGFVGKKPGTGSNNWFASTDHFDFAKIRAEFDTIENGVVQQGLREMPFSLKTGNFPLAFEVFGRMRINGTRGVGFRTDPAIPFDGSSAFGQVSVLTAKPGGKKKMMAAMGPDGSVQFTAVTRDERAAHRNEWINVGGQFTGPLTVVGVEDSRVSMFALDRHGAPFHKSYSEGDRPDAEWQPLGGTFAGRLTVVAGRRDSLDLFAIDNEGSVFHRSLDGGRLNNETGKWERIGSKTGSALAALYSARAGLAVFALGRNGNVLYKRRERREWVPGAERWESLGGRFEGVLTARLLSDGGVLLVVISSDRSVHSLTWQDYPERKPEEGWQRMGTIDSIFESLLQESRRPTGL
jgi:hypothetical protein